MRSTLARIGMMTLCAVALAAGQAARAADDGTVVVKARAKPDKPWKEYPTRTLAALPGFAPETEPSKLDRFGGLADRKEKATGFFHAKKLGDRWWLVDPEGGLFLHVGVADVAAGKSAASREASAKKFKSPGDWSETTTRLLLDHAFNGAGAWSDVNKLRIPAHPVVYTQIWDFMSGFGKSKKLTHVASGHAGYTGDCIPVFHPDFEAWCDQHAKALEPTRGDPYLLGHFSDNEMPPNSIEKYLALDANDPDTSPNQQAARDWLDARKGKAFDVKKLTDDDRAAWAEYVLDRYHRIVTTAMRKYDPNHLFLGCRYHGSDQRSEAAFRAAGRYCDVISYNYYGKWTPDEALVKQWAQWSGKPCMITEFYVKGDDAGFANTSGAGWIVPTQHDRGLFYQNFTLGLIESKNCVGWHWFKYMDNDPNATGGDPSNTDSNKGIVSITFEPYKPLLDEMKPLNKNVYRLADYFDKHGEGK